MDIVRCKMGLIAIDFYPMLLKNVEGFGSVKSDPDFLKYF